MSTKINTLELYVKGVQAYPNNMQKTELESVLGFWPEDLDDSAILAERLKTRPTNCLNYNLMHDYYMLTPFIPADGWHDYWNVTNENIPTNTLIYWPEFTNTQLSSLTGKYDLGGPNCIEYPNIIDLSKGIVDLYAPAENQTYEWHWNWDVLCGGNSFVQDHFGHQLGLNFNKCDVLKFNGNQIPHAWSEELADYSTNISTEYRWMFQGCTRLREIDNLNLSGFDMTHTNTLTLPTDDRSGMQGLEKYFMNCENLKILQNITWPTYNNASKFTGPCYSYMFYNCRSLPNNQFPTMDFAVAGQINSWDGEQDVTGQLYTNCEYIFYGCEKMTTQHITLNSLSNINNLTMAYAYSGITSLELPNNMNEYTRIPWIIQGCKDLLQLIIRTEGLAGDKSSYWEQTVRGKDAYDWQYVINQNQLFKPSDVNMLNAHLAIYVPDSELQDWIDMHANTGESDIDQRVSDMFHGLSELSA